jgi:hypothetical protein
MQNNPDITLKLKERMLMALRALANEEGQTTPALINVREKASTMYERCWYPLTELGVKCHCDGHKTHYHLQM